MSAPSPFYAHYYMCKLRGLEKTSYSVSCSSGSPPLKDPPKPQSGLGNTFTANKTETDSQTQNGRMAAGGKVKGLRVWCQGALCFPRGITWLFLFVCF